MRQSSDPQTRRENISGTAETNKESLWSSGTCAIVDDKGKLQKHGIVKVFYFLGARINDMSHHLMHNPTI